MNRPEAAVIAFRGAQELRPDLRSYQGQLISLGRKREKVVMKLLEKSTLTDANLFNYFVM